MISVIIQNVILAILYIYYFSKVIEMDINYKNHKYYVSLIFYSLVLIIMNTCNIYYLIKLPLNLLFMYIVMTYLFRPKLSKCLSSVFLIYFILVISEVFLAIVLRLLDYSFSSIGYFQIEILNILNIFISLYIINLKEVKKFKRMLFDFSEKMQKQIIVLLIISLFCLLVFYLFEIENKVLYIYIAILVIIIFSLIITILIKDFLKQKIYNEYDNLNKYVKEYEFLLDEQIKKNHEFKNQLIVIMSMIDNKKTKRYISKLLNEEININNELLNDLNKIPVKGIKGLIYYKLIIASRDKIDIKLDIGCNYEDDILLNITENELIDLTKLVGIFIDNAIEAVLNLDDKQISISIYINENNEFIISIANNFDNSINVEKILKNRYTTKGKNHGYGLLLAGEIIRKNKKIRNKREIISNVFIQNIIYKI